MKYELLLQGGHVVDPKNGADGIRDIGISGGKIEACEKHLEASAAKNVLNVSGKYVIPGIIDPHVHMDAPEGHKMLAMAGVTTALEMAGPADKVWQAAAAGGCGMNLAMLDALRVGDNVESTDPSSASIRGALHGGMEKGALGVKILGGHYPMSPDSIIRTIEIANEEKAYVAFHAGSAASGSNLQGALEAVRLAGNNCLHLAHINSYCRGMIKTPIEETQEIIAALTAHPKIRTESYLSVMNGSPAAVCNGTPVSRVISNCLKMGSYPQTEAGLEQAILDGWCNICVPEGGVILLRHGQEARDYWRMMGTDTLASFPVNPVEPRYLLASAKRPNGEFVVDAFSTDGGTLPRNEILAKGLSLIKLQAITWGEFVKKTSINPAKMLGLSNRGSLGEGAAADITVVDFEKQTASATVVGGKIVMYEGLVTGHGLTAITTEKGAGYLKEHYGFETMTVCTAESAFYRGL